MYFYNQTVRLKDFTCTSELLVRDGRTVRFNTCEYIFFSLPEQEGQTAVSVFGNQRSRILIHGESEDRTGS